MATVIADIDSRVFAEAAAFNDHFTFDDVHRCVVNALSLRTALTRKSDSQQLLNVTADFTPTSLDQSISVEQGGVPLWIEYYLSTNSYFPIRTVDLQQIPIWRESGDLAAAFSTRDTETDPTRGSTHFVTFSYLPPAACRVWYEGETVKTILDGQSFLPDYVIDLIVLESVNRLLKTVIQPKVVMETRRDPALRGMVSGILGVINDMYDHNMVEIRTNGLLRLWQAWAFGDRASRDKVYNNPTPSAGGIYGD